MVLILYWACDDEKNLKTWRFTTIVFACNDLNSRCREGNDSNVILAIALCKSLNLSGKEGYAGTQAECAEWSAWKYN